MSIDNIAATPLVPANLKALIAEAPACFKALATNAGFATSHTVHAAYENGIALFVYETVRSRAEARRVACVAYGLGVFHAQSFKEAMALGIDRARNCLSTDPVRRMTPDEFSALCQLQFDPAAEELELLAA